MELSGDGGKGSSRREDEDSEKFGKGWDNIKGFGKEEEE